ncbi:MAG: glucose-6-phosphate isomerase, partial [Burkholderiaceae bacterium]|nr:glucose-6-phosphate isomerase [Burkholderiaceae bacterium]
MRHTATSPLTASARFQALQAHHHACTGRNMRQLFAANPARFSQMTIEAAGLLLDYSKNRLDADALCLLADLARERGVEARRDAMFGGEKINVTEGRAVLHTALRAPRGATVNFEGKNVVPDVHDTLDRMAAFADRVRSGAWTG